MSIFKIFDKEIKDIYQAIKSSLVNDILYGPETLYINDNENNKIKLNVPDRIIAAKAIRRISQESNIEPLNNETVEDYVLRASLTDILKENEELIALRKQAKEAGI